MFTLQAFNKWTVEYSRLLQFQQLYTTKSGCWVGRVLSLLAGFRVFFAVNSIRAPHTIPELQIVTKLTLVYHQPGFDVRLIRDPVSFSLIDGML